MKKLDETVTADELIARLDAGRAAEKNLPAWNCPGCGDVIHAPEKPALLQPGTREPGDPPPSRRKQNEHLDVFEYLRAATCRGACHRIAAAREVPRTAVLARAKAPLKIQRTLFRRSLANDRVEYPPGESLAWNLWSGEPSTVLLHGPNGTGKGMLSGQMLVQCWRAGRIGVRWIQAPELMYEHFDDEARTRPLWRAASQCEVLVLDEFGRGKAASEYAAGIVCQLLEARLGRERPTIMPTNLEPESGRPSLRSLDSALYDRLVGGLVYRMGGESLRRRNG